MAELSGLGALQRPATTQSSSRYSANWRARFFGVDKVIHMATIIGIDTHGFSLTSEQSAPLGSQLNVEFVVNYRNKPTRIRFKSKVDYTLIKTNGVEMELSTLSISREHKHIVNNLLQLVISSPNIDLRL